MGYYLTDTARCLTFVPHGLNHCCTHRSREEYWLLASLFYRFSGKSDVYCTRQVVAYLHFSEGALDGIERLV
jgi:hypothetical protein